MQNQNILYTIKKKWRKNKKLRKNSKEKKERKMMIMRDRRSRRGNGRPVAEPNAKAAPPPPCLGVEQLQADDGMSVYEYRCVD